MRFLMIAACVVAVSLSTSNPARADEKPQEVHLVGINEGFKATGETVKGPRSLVTINRPGKEITLVLTANSSVTWHITTSKDTRIRNVFLGGSPQQAVKGVPETATIMNVWRGATARPLSCSYRPAGTKFRRLVQEVFELTGLPLASFNGAYCPKADAPFTIDTVQDDPRLSPAYPLPIPLNALPEDVRKAEFLAHQYLTGGRYQAPAMSFGRFTVLGPDQNALTPLPQHVRRMAYDPEKKTYFGISNDRVVQISQDMKSVKTLDPGLDVPRMSSTYEITFDSKHRRLIVGSSNYLYAYAPDSEEWSVIARRPGDVVAFAYSAADEFLYGVLFEHGDDGDPATLVKINSKGAIVSSLPLSPAIEPGQISVGPRFHSIQVAIVGKYVAVLGSPGRPGEEDTFHYSSIYLVDYKTKQVWLTAKIDTKKPIAP